MSPRIFYNDPPQIEGEYVHQEDGAYKSIKVDWANPSSVEEGLEEALENTFGELQFEVSNTEDFDHLVKNFKALFDEFEFSREKPTQDRVLVEDYQTVQKPAAGVNRYEHDMKMLKGGEIEGFVLRDVLRSDAEREVGYLKSLDAYVFRIEVFNERRGEIMAPLDLGLKPTEQTLYAVFDKEGEYRYLINFSDVDGPKVVLEQLAEGYERPSALYLETGRRDHRQAPRVDNILEAQKAGMVVGVRKPSGCYEKENQVFEAYSISLEGAPAKDIDPFEGIDVFE